MSRIAVVVGTVLFATLGAGCFTSDEGLNPPPTFYFPTGVAVSPGGGTLYVVNSDFDLQYNGGTIEAVNLQSLRKNVQTLQTSLNDGKGADAACEALGLSINEDDLLYPGPCSALDVDPYILKAVTIGAFASGATLVANPDEPGARLLVPVRGDPSLTYLDVADDSSSERLEATCPSGDCLECGADGSGRCSAQYRVGEDPFENQRQLTLPVEPVGIAVAEATDAVLMAHQTEASVSLVVNRWDQKPTLEYYLTDLPDGPAEVATVPVPKYISANPDVLYQPGFVVTYRAAAQVDLLRYRDDEQASPSRPFLTKAGGFGIAANASGSDSRGIAIDGSARQSCEAECADSLDCLRACAEEIPLRVFVANRAPASLLVGEIQTEFSEEDGVITSGAEVISFYDSIPLSYGASKVSIGNIIGSDGEKHLRVFAVAFDSRLVFSYDPDARQVDAVIRTGRGPHAIALDTDVNNEYAFLYVGHFTDSYVGVVDLDQRNTTFGSMILTVGIPVAPRESK